MSGGYRAKCCCGATIEIDDVSNTFINAGGAPNAKGQRYQGQVYQDIWVEQHKDCNALLAKKTPGQDKDEDGGSFRLLGAGTPR